MLRNLTIISLLVLLGAATAYLTSDKQSASKPFAPDSDHQVEERSDKLVVHPFPSHLSDDFKNKWEGIQLQRIDLDSELGMELLGIFEDWASENPEAAIAEAKTFGDKKGALLRAVMRGWAKSGDPEAAWNWVQSRPEDENVSLFFWEIANTLSNREEYAKALSLIQTLESEFKRPGQSIENGTQTGLARLVLEKWSRSDPSSALDWLLTNEDSLPEPLFEASLKGYIQPLSYEEPKEACDWLSTLPEGPIRARVLNDVMGTWFFSDAEAALTWLTSIDHQDLEWVLGKQAHNFSHIDPELAFELIRQTETDDISQASYEGLAIGNLMRKDPSFAARWLSENQDALSKDPLHIQQIRHNTYKSYYPDMITTWAAVDETAAFEFLEDIPGISEEDQEQARATALEQLRSEVPTEAVALLLSKWTLSDFKTANSFIDPLRNSEGFGKLYKHAPEQFYIDIAIEWAKTDPDRVAYYLSKQKLLSRKETDTLLEVISPLQ